MHPPAVLPAAGLVLVLLAACTGADRPVAAPARTPSTAAAPPAPVVLTVAPGAGTAVVSGATPSALSLAVSRALLAAAPVVVVAAGADVPRAGQDAGRLHVPLLVAAGGGAAADDGLRAELSRLHTRAVLAVGAVAGQALAGRTELHTETDSGRLPAVQPAGPARLTVLVHPGAPAAAVTPTARAAGARVVVVHGDDPRGDPVAVAALATAPPGRVVAAGASFGPATRLAARVAVAATGRQLPGGGQRMFPGRRLVALYGFPGTPSLGALGEQGTAAAIARARRVARPYRRLSTVPVVPAFEVIVTVAQGSPGRDGDYSGESSVASLRPVVEQAGAAGLYVVLDLQPGRASFLAQARRYAELLRLPYVGLALDAEWRLAPGQRPLGQIGSVDVREVNAVVRWLADLTAQARLPQKLLVVHQFRLSMLRHEAALDTSRDEVALLVHMDGQGAPRLKDATWAAVTRAAPPGVRLGWKNFYDEDTPTLTPAQTMLRRPTPVMISYQ